MLGRIAALWGFIGVCFFLGSAIFKLSLISSQLDVNNLSVFNWLVMLAWILFMAYFEGYKGFQKGFSPRVAARLYFLLENVTYKRLVLAPLFCLGFFDAERKRIIFIYCLTSAIFLMVKFVEQVPMPWRGILDVGVVVGLSWGLLSVTFYSIKAFAGRGFIFPNGVPKK